MTKGLRNHAVVLIGMCIETYADTGCGGESASNNQFDEFHLKSTGLRAEPNKYSSEIIFERRAT
ncbi:hypothetical protein SynBIOSE41_01485 [Synechococcus sp. BIOS-E4-1]|nr:hypothetical protein SynBIOSE41_01485 [Synechococcus sp. BIOS-E4-1]